MIDLRRIFPALALASALAAPPVLAHAQTARFCAPGVAPAFLLGFGKLKTQIGATMGEPLECEHADPATGDAQQHTTTGLAYFRDESGVVAFTNGWEHYALDGDRVLLWRNASIDPPTPDVGEAAFLRQTISLRSNADRLDEQLTLFQRYAQAGDLDSVPFEDIGSVLDDLAQLHETFAALAPPQSLATYADLWERSQLADSAAADALLRARLADDPAVRADRMQDVGVELLRRDQLRAAARSAYTQALAIDLQTGG